MKELITSVVIVTAAVAAHAQTPAESQTPVATQPATSMDAITASQPTESDSFAKRWSFQAGVAFITASTVDDLLVGDVKMADGPAGGQIYLFEASYKIYDFDPVIADRQLDVDFQLPLVLGIVDEHSNSPFLQPSAGFSVRWKSFPWNDWLYTNLETGVGLTYSEHVLGTERDRHPGRDRSHLEFYWPVQFTFALPEHRQHQLVLLLHHHSGGAIFHSGGANSLGVAYRYVFGER